MSISKELLEKAKTAKTAEELLTMAKAENVELTAEQAAEYFAKLNARGELSDEELDNVSGGGCDRNANSFIYSRNPATVTYRYSIGDVVEVFASEYFSPTIRCRIIDRTTDSKMYIRSLAYYPTYKVVPVDSMLGNASAFWVEETNIQR